MDKIQVAVREVTPEFNRETGCIAFVLASMFWASMFFVVHLSMVTPFMYSREMQQRFRSIRFFKDMFYLDQWYYSSYLVAIIHAVFAFSAAIWSFFYADGEKGTTWNHCNYFRLNMFDIQKYLHVFSGSFYYINTLFGYFA